MTTNAKGMKPSDIFQQIVDKIIEEKWSKAPIWMKPMLNKAIPEESYVLLEAIKRYLDETSKYYINSRTVYWMGVEMGMKIAKSEKQHEAKGEV